jgi:hypothetical protein
MSDLNISAQPEPLSLKDVAGLPVKHYGLHEGLWELALEVGVGVGQFGNAPDMMLPGATFGISRIGLVRAEKEGPKSVNAAVLNPATPRQPSSGASDATG